MQTAAGIILLSAVTLLLSSSVAKADSPPAGSVVLSGLATSGPGCPEGSVAANTSPDNLAFTLLFDQFIVSGDAHSGPQHKLSCRADVTLEVPTGWSFSVLTVDTRGYASLATHQVKVDVSSRVAIGDNNGNAAHGDVRLRGPYEDNFQIRAAVSGNSGRWSVCGTRRHRVRIDTEIKMKREAVAAIDSLDGQVEALGLAWRRCR